MTKKYLHLPGLSRPLKDYTLHPNLMPYAFAHAIMDTISRARNIGELQARWFDVWDIVMSRFAMIEAGKVHVGHPYSHTLRGTVLNSADIVTDLANEVIVAAQQEFPMLRPFLQNYPSDIWERWTVVDISESGIIVEVVYEPTGSE